MKNKEIILYFAAIILLILPSCDSNKTTSNKDIQNTFSSIYINVLSKNCVACHEPQGSATLNSQTTIDFSSKNLSYQSLVNGTSVGFSANISGQCNNVPLVSPHTPNDSYLLATLSSNYNHSNFYKNGCSPYSPNAHAATISSDEFSALVSWIQNGALNN